MAVQRKQRMLAMRKPVRPKDFAYKKANNAKCEGHSLPKGAKCKCLYQKTGDVMRMGQEQRTR